MDDELFSQTLTALSVSQVDGFDVELLEALTDQLIDIHVAAASITMTGPAGTVTHVSATDNTSGGVERRRYLSGSAGVPALQTEPSKVREHDPDELIVESCDRHDEAVSVGDDVDAGQVQAEPELVVNIYPIHDRHTAIIGTVVVYSRDEVDVGGVTERAARQVAAAAADHAASRNGTGEPDVTNNDSRVEWDHLTGLANHTQVLGLLRAAVRHSRRSKLPTAVIYVRVDAVRVDGTTVTSLQRDQVLVHVARRLEDLDVAGHSVARVAASDFVVFCEDVPSPDDAQRLCVAVGELVTTCPVGHTNGVVEARVGYVLVSPAGDNQAGAINDARAVMLGGDPATAVVNTSDGHDMFPAGVPLRDLERDLPGAAARGELYLVYQPIVSTADGQITSVEALLRWEHPQHGPIPATVTIGVAERTDEIVRIGRWVLERACRDRARWQQRSATVAVAVNVSAQQLMSEGFVASVAATLANTRIDAHSLILEITETVFVDDTNVALVVLNNLKALGVQIAIDDFGTGYATLTYLKRYPADILKLDREFIADLADDAASQLIVGAVVNLARLMGMSVTAEGVETTEQQLAVVDAGCQHSQGYLFARPMESDDVDMFLEYHREHTNQSAHPSRPPETVNALTGRTR